MFILIALAIFFGFQFWLQRQVATYASTQTESHNRFVWLLVHILVQIAQLDGHVSRDEVHTIQRFFQYNLHYNQTKMAWVKNLIKEGIAHRGGPFGIETDCGGGGGIVERAGRGKTT